MEVLWEQARIIVGRGRLKARLNQFIEQMPSEQ